MAQIHPTAIVDPAAKLGQDVEIGPYCVVGGQVELGDRVHLISHVVVDGITSIGEGTVVYPFASLGLRPQDLKYHGEPSTLVIGNSGSAMEGHIDPSDAQGRQPAPGAVVSTFVTHAQFGYATLERPHDAGPWVLTAWSTQGAVMARCQLAAGRLSCPATPPGA